MCCGSSGGHWVGGHGSGPSGLAGGQLHGQLVAADFDHLHHGAQQQAHQRQSKRQFDRCLTAV